MAISRMAKVIIISHRSEATELLEALQREGICQILNSEEATVSRDMPELATEAERPRDIEQTLNRLNGTIAFLKNYSKSPGGLAGIFSPRAIVDERAYASTVTDRRISEIVERSERCVKAMEQAKSRSEKASEILAKLEPWQALGTPVEQLTGLRTSSCFVGLLAAGQIEQLAERLAELNGAVQQVGTSGNRVACLIVCVNENAAEAQKLLRSAEFEPVSFEGMSGTVTEMLKEHRSQLEEAENQLRSLNNEAATLAEDILKLQILDDHYSNLLSREQTEKAAPATAQTVILEGWAKEKNFSRLEEVVSRFKASSLSRIEPAEGEEIPVEIENKNIIKPFEVITRLYGMPQHFEVDPTVFLAPFFALFFALCLTDAGYGLVIIALMAFFIRNMQGDKKLCWMLGICAVFTIATGALTGGWFGDAVQQFVPALKPLREKMMWFDPLEKPMMFFGLSIVLGYGQIMAGLLIAFAHNIRRKEYVAAVCDQLTWLVMLNSIVIFGVGKAGMVSAEIGGLFGKLALIPAGVILLFSQRQGGWAGRIGMGVYSLFSAIFYMGDVLSYLRLMALGMVTAGLAMAINVMAKIALDIPYGLGVAVCILVLVGGHGFNIAISGLSAFVHTLRLQYVEFFPKFFVGGGRAFEPLSKEYKHVCIVKREA